MSLFFSPCDLWRKCAALAGDDEAEYLRGATGTGSYLRSEPLADRRTKDRRHGKAESAPQDATAPRSAGPDRNPK